MCDLLGVIGLQVALQGEQQRPVQRSQAFSSPQQGHGCKKTQGQGGHEAATLWEMSWDNVGDGMLEGPKKPGCAVNDEIQTGQRVEDYHVLRYIPPLPGGLRSWLRALVVMVKGGDISVGKGEKFYFFHFIFF